MKARRTVDKKFQERIRDEVKKEFEKQSNDMTCRNFKLICVALNQTFGFGKDRLMRLIQAVEDIGREREQDEVFWSHIDQFVIGQLGLAFKEEDYEKMDG